MIDENNKFYKPDRGSANEPDHIMISFCGNPKSEIAISWRTDWDINSGYVEYWSDSNNEHKRKESISRQFESDIDRNCYHTVKLDNLEAGAKYYYTCGNSTTRSEMFSFTTEQDNNNEFSFLVITDHQKGNPTHLPDYSCINRLVSNALKKHPEVRFILTGGDNCDNGQNDLQWNGMFSGLKGIIESIPYMMTTGNHDNRGFVSYFPEPTGKFYLEHADFFDFQFKYAFPYNGPEGYETENYSFDYGNTHFNILGINAPDIVSEWAYNDMQNSKSTWKISTYHFPLYPIMPEGQNNDGYPWLRKAIEQGRPDIVINGHEHSFARTYPITGDQMFDKPSEGTIHYIAGNAGGNIYHSNTQKVWHSCFYPQEERMGLYSIFHIKDNVLTATAYMEDGRIVDKFVIDKNNDEILPYSLAPKYDLTKMCFKGRMLEMSARRCYCENINGTWFAPIGVLIQSQGGKVIKGADSLECELYNHFAKFKIGEKTVFTDKGSISLNFLPYFKEGQMYLPVDDTAKIFELEWYWAERNNYINWNSPHEEATLYKHPEQ